MPGLCFIVDVLSLYMYMYCTCIYTLQYLGSFFFPAIYSHIFSALLIKLIADIILCTVQYRDADRIEGTTGDLPESTGLPAYRYLVYPHPGRIGRLRDSFLQKWGSSVTIILFQLLFFSCCGFCKDFF